MNAGKSAAFHPTRDHFPALPHMPAAITQHTGCDLDHVILAFGEKVDRFIFFNAFDLFRNVFLQTESTWFRKYGFENGDYWSQSFEHLSRVYTSAWIVLISGGIVCI